MGVRPHGSEKFRDTSNILMNASNTSARPGTPDLVVALSLASLLRRLSREWE